MLGGLTFAQTTTEILQISQSNALGTARYNGLSGAFGALGGDLTALTINPAGSAVFQNSYGSITLQQNSNRLQSDFIGNLETNNNSNINFNQIGAVLILKNTAEKGASKIALGLSYNKTNNFRNRLNFSGETNNSISDFFAGQANGIDSSNFFLNQNESLRDAYIGIGDEFGFSGQQGLLGFQGLLIDNIENNPNTSLFESNVRTSNGEINPLQIFDIETSGNSGKITFNAAAEFKDRFYIGTNLNFHSLNYNRRVVFDEFISENQPNTQNISGARFINLSETIGSGFSLDLGAIAKVSDLLRVGLSYQSPIFYQLQDSFSQQLETFFNDNSSQLVDPNVSVLLPEHQFRSPSTISGSVALVAGKKALISGQYSRKDFSKTKFTSNGDAFDELNATIENTFTVSDTYSIGGEYRNKNWSFRGGFSKTTSPYKNKSIAGDTNGFSLGTGYNWGKWKFDVAYNKTSTERRETLFEDESFDNFADVNQRNSAVSLTLGVNF